MTSRRVAFGIGLLLSALPPAVVAGVLDRMQIAEGFRVEEVYSVPRETRGSWVALTVDPKGRLLAGDQRGRIYRVEPDRGDGPKIEALDVPIGHAHGLLFAFGSLYVVAVTDKYQGSGLYRVRDTDGDDRFDQVELLRSFTGGTEHGPHSVILGPDGKSLLVCAGNHTEVPRGPGFRTLVPPHWGEDDLLPRLWGPIGSEKGTPAPGGWIARTDPDGESWELLAIGLRNAFDLAVHRDGELFTTDADAEFDLGTPWYQPTRLLHIVAGVDYGWRSGSGKWRLDQPDTLAPAHVFGPGSPTGLTFGYGAKFPVRYQNALFACDWSYGRIFAVHLREKGAGYEGAAEEFLTGLPLPVADIVVHPRDGALYFVLGGRGTTSGLYRVTYHGPADSRWPVADDLAPRSRKVRRDLESRIGDADSPGAIRLALLGLANPDPAIRASARVLLEHAPPDRWRDAALKLAEPEARIHAALALARAGAPEDYPPLRSALLKLDWNQLNRNQRRDWLRAWEVASIRMLNQADDAVVRRHLEKFFPAHNGRLDVELLKLLVRHRSASATEPAVRLLATAATQEHKLALMLPLRVHRQGWTKSLRARFFAEIAAAQKWKGGRSLVKYVEMIDEEALAHVPESERASAREQLTTKAAPPAADEDETFRPFVRAWQVADLLPLDIDQLRRRDAAKGRVVFHAARCGTCHRFQEAGGGMGPDLSAVTRRFSPRDLLESILEPSKVISDQYGITAIRKTDGSQLNGRVVNYARDLIMLQTDLLNPAELERIPRRQIESMKPSQTSLMPAGLLNGFQKAEILDLLAYLYAQ